MTPAAFGVIHAALVAIDADLSDERLDALDPERLAAAWRASGDICKIADSLHGRLRSALTHALTTASRSGGAA
jgi:hypothetical protein